MSSFEVYLNTLFSQSTPPPIRPTTLPSNPTSSYRTPVCPVSSYTPGYYSLTPYTPPTSYSPLFYLPTPGLTPYLSHYKLCSQSVSPLLKPPSPSTSQYCSFSSNCTLETPLFTPEPLATSTPACLISPQHLTPPTTPGKRELTSPPRFFFPPDFSLPSCHDTKEDSRSTNLPDSAHPSPPSSQTPSSFGKTQRRRRHRTKFSTSQISTLEEEFEKCSYVSAERRRELSETLGIKEQTIRVWFQNRRTLMKKMNNNHPKQNPF